MNCSTWKKFIHFVFLERTGQFAGCRLSRLILTLWLDTRQLGTILKVVRKCLIPGSLEQHSKCLENARYPAARKDTEVWENVWYLRLGMNFKKLLNTAYRYCSPILDIKPEFSPFDVHLQQLCWAYDCCIRWTIKSCFVWTIF